MLRLASILSILGVLLWAVPAEAQLYSWRDENGHLVISDRPHEGAVRTFAVRPSSSLRTTAPPPPHGYASAWDAEIDRVSAVQSVRPDLVRAVIQVESGFDPQARSNKGAMGLMQIMPQTAAELGLVDPFDPIPNIRAGVAYLRQLLDRYEGNEELALAAYNAGPVAVEKYGYAVPPYRETRAYVSRVRNATGNLATRSRVRRVIYKTVEVINGREVPRYSDSKPSSGRFEVVAVER